MSVFYFLFLFFFSNHLLTVSQSLVFAFDVSAVERAEARDHMESVNIVRKSTSDMENRNFNEGVTMKRKRNA